MYEKSKRQIGVDILAQLVAIDGLVSPSLVGPLSRRLVARILLGSLAETFVGPASSLELLEGGVADHDGDEGSDKSASLEDLGHRHDGYDVDRKNTVLLEKKKNFECFLENVK
jgi:hypothetical protein